MNEPYAIPYPVPRKKSLARCFFSSALCVWLCAMSLTTAAQGTSVVITRPQAGDTVHDNTGAVPVTVSVKGGVVPAAHVLRVLLDGKTYGAEQRTLDFVLQGVERGEHNLQVQLVDAKGTVVAASAPVTFYLWQASSQFPARKREAPPPK